jgi:hypothetical protein
MRPTTCPFRARLLVALAILVLCVFSPRYAGAAQSTAIVRPDPALLELKPGSEGSVALLFENAQDVYGLEVHLTFDPNLVQVVDSSSGQSGVQVQAADWLQGAFVAANRADNASGTLDFAATLLSPSSPVSGSQTFLTITLRAVQVGVSPLKIAAAILATRDGQIIASQWQDGQVRVWAEGKAAPASELPSSSSGSTRTAMLVAGVGVVVFLAALGVLIYALKARRKPGD